MTHNEVYNPQPHPTPNPETPKTIRDLLDIKNYVIVVEHDLSVLDYLSDFICCLYGKPGAYGVVTLPFSVREGINIFLAGGWLRGGWEPARGGRRGGSVIRHSTWRDQGHIAAVHDNLSTHLSSTQQPM
jgi:hypothetical protein